ncbi:MAG: hypothetical protein ACLVJ6_08915 [Merdibacter sp.]
MNNSRISGIISGVTVTFILYGIVLVCLFPLLALGLQNNLKTRNV